MRKEENWAVSPERIRTFLKLQPDVVERADCFLFRQCQIRLIPCTDVLLGRPQVRTLVIMEGPDPDTSQIYKRFFLRFLSAGG